MAPQKPRREYARDPESFRTIVDYTDPEKALRNTTLAEAKALQFIWGKVDLEVGSMHPAGCRPEHVGAA